jgi:glycosyltransferase involved in cell wall biosynthesis
MPFSPAPEDPVLSVVVPTHGRTDLFLQTIASLEQQTLGRFELVVTDDSPAAADRAAIEAATTAYSTRTGRSARYVYSRPNLGQARNTNQGLAIARGRVVRILHSDDLLAPKTLEAEVMLLNDPRLNIEVLFHLAVPFVDAPAFDRQPVLTLVQPSHFFRACLHSGTPLPSATAFKRRALQDVGGMREDFDFLCDWDFFYRLLLSQWRRHLFIGRLTAGYVGWRVHPDSTTGRLWHRHFLEHEQLMGEIERDAHLTESLIGDEGTRAGFFATAVRYRYRRLKADIGGMSWRHACRAVPLILRCALSPRSVRDRLQPAPWTPRGRRRYPNLVVPCEASGGSPVASPGFAALIEPRRGWRFALSAYVSAAIIAWGKARARTVASDSEPDDDRRPVMAGPELVSPIRSIELAHTIAGADAEPGTLRIVADYDNSLNLWPLRDLIGGSRQVVLNDLNCNAFVEPVLHQCVKFTQRGTRLEVRLFDNQHLTSFGFKSLLERQFPGQFAWAGQERDGSLHVLRYERRTSSHRCYWEPHTGWTFGMLTTGTRLENVRRFIDSIERHCREPYEILIVSPKRLGDLERRRGVRVILFAERDDLGWITRKKNLICAEAAFSDILVCHDRFSIDPEFAVSFSQWGFAYGLAAPRVRLPDGRRGLDWAVVSSQNHVWSSGGLLDYRAYSQYAYNPGGATIVRKAFWRDFPWNENLFWNEHEDVELCRRIQRAGGVIALAAAAVVAAEDRWVDANPPIPYCDQNEVLYGRPVGEQRILFLQKPEAA